MVDGVSSQRLMDRAVALQVGQLPPDDHHTHNPLSCHTSSHPCLGDVLFYASIGTMLARICVQVSIHVVSIGQCGVLILL